MSFIVMHNLQNFNILSLEDFCRRNQAGKKRKEFLIKKC